MLQSWRWNWGIGFEGEEGDWRSEFWLLLLLPYLLLWHAWLAGSQGIPSGVEGLDKGIGGSWCRRSAWSTGDGNREGWGGKESGLLQSSEWDWGLDLKERRESWRFAVSLLNFLACVLPDISETHQLVLICWVGLHKCFHPGSWLWSNNLDLVLKCYSLGGHRPCKANYYWWLATYTCKIKVNEPFKKRNF